MAHYRILIVDDQVDIRRMLKAGIETLGPDFKVMDMPSAEEALLEITRQQVDLLVSDIRLPGISGLELVVKARRRIPDLKIILITAMTDSRTRRQAGESGVNAFFNKPLDLPDFLDAVERMLGVVETFLPPLPVAPPEPIVPTQSISEKLAGLRQELGAIAVVLLDDQGHILAQAGDLPEFSQPAPALSLSLLTALNASSKVSLSLGVKVPQNLLCIPGKEFHLCLAHVGPTHALVAATGPQNGRFPAETAGAVVVALSGAVPALLACLTSLGAAPLPQENGAELSASIQARVEAAGEEADEAAPGEELNKVEAIFERPPKKKMTTKDLDNYWDSAVKQSDSNNLGNASVISYDQAKKLGLAPKDKP
jgi:CheY-like chemotaxis protein